MPGCGCSIKRRGWCWPRALLVCCSAESERVPMLCSILGSDGLCWAPARICDFTDTGCLCSIFYWREPALPVLRAALPVRVIAKLSCKCCLLATTKSTLAFAGSLITCLMVVTPLTRSSDASLTKPGLAYPSCTTASGSVACMWFLQALSTSPRTSIHFLPASLRNNLFVRACWQYFTP